MSDLSSRVAALEAAVAELTRSRTDEPSTGPHDAPGSDPYFALTALKREVPPPGGVVLAGHVALPDGPTAEWQFGLTTQTLLDEDWSARSTVISALAHPVRLQLLQEVLRGVSTAAGLSEVEGLGTTGQVYHHLRILIGAGWLQATTRGRHEVPLPRVVPLLAMLLAARS